MSQLKTILVWIWLFPFIALGVIGVGYAAVLLVVITWLSAVEVLSGLL